MRKQGVQRGFTLQCRSDWGKGGGWHRRDQAAVTVLVKLWPGCWGVLKPELEVSHVPQACLCVSTPSHRLGAAKTHVPSQNTAVGPQGQQLGWAVSMLPAADLRGSFS